MTAMWPQAQCCHNITLEGELEGPTYPWFAETYIAHIYSGNWICILIFCHRRLTELDLSWDPNTTDVTLKDNICLWISFLVNNSHA